MKNAVHEDQREDVQDSHRQEDLEEDVRDGRRAQRLVERLVDGQREDVHVGEGLVGEGLVGEGLTDELGEAIQDDDVREGDLPNLVPCG